MKLLFFFLLVPCFCFAQSSQTLHQYFTLDNSNTLTIHVNNPDLVSIEKIQGSRLLVETKVLISTNNLTLLNFIAKQGRYNLSMEADAATQNINLKEKAKKNTLIVKGETLSEEVAYTFYVPDAVSKVEISGLQ